MSKEKYNTFFCLALDVGVVMLEGYFEKHVIFKRHAHKFTLYMYVVEIGISKNFKNGTAHMYTSSTYVPVQEEFLFVHNAAKDWHIPSIFLLKYYTRLLHCTVVTRTSEH